MGDTTLVTSAQLANLRGLSSAAIKGAVGKRLRAAGQIVAEAAKSISGGFSQRIPASIKVTGGTTEVWLVAGGDSAPNAAPFEDGSMHPVFATGNRSTWHWARQPKRPFMDEAATQTADLAAEEFALVVDDWCTMLGLSDLFSSEATMQIHWQGEDFDFAIDEMTVAQAKVIKVHTGFTLRSLSEGINDGDPDALRATYWLMHAQTPGKTCNIDNVDFKLVEFINTLAEATKAEAEAQAALKQDTPKEDQ